MLEVWVRNQHLSKARQTRLEKHMTDLLKIYQELQKKKWVNLSHQIKEDSPHFPAMPDLEKKDIFTLFKNLQWLVNTERISMLRFTL